MFGATRHKSSTEGGGISPKISSSPSPPSRVLNIPSALAELFKVCSPRNTPGSHACPSCQGHGGGAGAPHRGPCRARENPFDVAVLTRSKLIPCCDISTRCFLEELYWGTGLMLQLFSKVFRGLFPD